VLDVLRYAGDREALLTEVLASGLVRRAEDERLELVQASVEARLSRGVLPADQRKIHARAAEVLRRVEAPSPAVRAAIVHHLVAAADDVGVAEQAPPAARAQPTQGAARVLWVAGLEALGRLRAGAPGSYDEVARRVLAEATPVVARGSLDEARRLLGDSGLDVDAPTEGAALARAARGEVLLALGQPSEAEADVRAAVALLPLDAGPAVRAPVVEALARVLEERGALPEAAEHLHAVAALYEAADDHAELWRPLNALGRLYVRLGRHDRAHALLLAASEAAAAAWVGAGPDRHGHQPSGAGGARRRAGAAGRGRGGGGRQRRRPGHRAHRLQPRVAGAVAGTPGGGRGGPGPGAACQHRAGLGRRHRAGPPRACGGGADVSGARTGPAAGGAGPHPSVHATWTWLGDSFTTGASARVRRRGAPPGRWADWPHTPRRVT
jgi:tetratricopeptide (TPR) repeat protein